MKSGTVSDFRSVPDFVFHFCFCFLFCFLFLIFISAFCSEFLLFLNE